jgi:hypothetical protein
MKKFLLAAPDSFKHVHSGVRPDTWRRILVVMSHVHFGGAGQILNMMGNVTFDVVGHQVLMKPFAYVQSFRLMANASSDWTGSLSSRTDSFRRKSGSLKGS